MRNGLKDSMSCITWLGVVASILSFFVGNQCRQSGILFYTPEPYGCSW